MPDNTNSGATATLGRRTAGISASTPIIFTVKSFFATLGSLLGLFASFYFVIIVPSMKSNVELQDKLYEEQKEYITLQFNEVKGTMNKNTAAIGLNTAAINSTNARFEDLNTSVTNLHNSGGSFGTASTGGVTETDPSLAEHN